MQLKLDNSRRSDMKRCPARYNYRFNHHLVTTYGNTKLRFGSVYHAVQEGYYSGVKKYGWKDPRSLERANQFGEMIWKRESEGLEFKEDFRTYSEVYKSFIEYLSYFANDSNFLEVVETESIIRKPMILTSEELGKFPLLATIDLIFEGKIDMKLRMAGQAWLLDHKTTGWRLDILTEQSKRSPQFMGYIYGGTSDAFRPAGILVAFHHMNARYNKNTEDYRKVYRDYKRPAIIFNQGDLASWRASYLSTAEDIVRCQERNFWPQSHDDCYKYNKWCSYKKLCEQNKPFEDLDTTGFVEREWHVEDTTT